MHARRGRVEASSMVFEGASQSPAYSGFKPIVSQQFTAARNMFNQAGQRITRYDQLAQKPQFVPSETGFLEKWGTGSGKRFLRDTLSLYGDKVFAASKHNAAVTGIHNTLSPWAKNALHYRDILGIDTMSYASEIGKGKYFKNYWDFFTSPEGREAWRKGINKNFERFLDPTLRQNLTFGSFLKQLVWGDNVKTISEPLGTEIKNAVTGEETGKVKSCTSLLRTISLGVFLWGILSKTQDAYRVAKSEEDGSFLSKLLTIGKTAYAFVTQSIKGLISWELGTIGFAIGMALIPVGGIPGFIAGAIGSGLFGAISYKLLSQVIADPAKAVEPTSNNTP